jgi:hypothetical protein
VHAFEEQVGSHGGLGGDQNRAFLMHPYSLDGPEHRIVGAEAVHAVLRGWLRPRDAEGGTRDGTREPGRSKARTGH